MTKKDYDFVAAVEVAIAEKYGKDTVQDFRSKWDSEKEKDYLEQLKDKKTKNKHIRNKKPNQNRTCPVCKTYSFSSKDDLYMNRFECCYLCYVDFVHQNPEKWTEGNRPTDKVINELLRRRKDGNRFGNN